MNLTPEDMCSALAEIPQTAGTLALRLWLNEQLWRARPLVFAPAQGSLWWAGEMPFRPRSEFAVRCLWRAVQWPRAIVYYPGPKRARTNFAESIRLAREQIAHECRDLGVELLKVRQVGQSGLRYEATIDSRVVHVAYSHIQTSRSLI